MPDISTYIKVNDKNFGESTVEVNGPKSDCICRKGVFRYGMILLAWVAVGFFLFYITLVVRRSCNHEGFNEEWEVYKTIYGKNYSQEEDKMRICIYLANKKEIDNHNNLFEAGIESYEKAINMFSDFTPEEMEELRGFRGHLESFPPADAFLFRSGTSYPESFDWRLKGAVTGVKNQEICGSCYAFSATGSLEAQHFLKTGKLVSLSEQNLVDCSTPQGNMGCKGGTMNKVFSYILQNNGINTEKSYGYDFSVFIPYEGKEGPCRFQRDTVGATIQGYRSVVPSEAALQAAVADIGPISVGIDATSNFVHYNKGIFDDNSCNSYILNHAVLVVGFGSEGGQDYWIVKNSWGTIWGESGYIRMARNKGNRCGIASMPSYPIV